MTCAAVGISLMNPIPTLLLGNSFLCITFPP